MKVFIVYGNPEPTSFNGAMIRVAQETPIPFHSIDVFPDPLGETDSEPEPILDALMERRKSA